MEEQQTFIGKNFCESKVLKQISLLILIIFLVSLIFLASAETINKLKEGKYIGQAVETKNTIVVSGTAESYIKPDLALINFSVVTEKKTVSEALAENATKMNTVIDSLKKQGVEEKNLKTTNFYIYPRYEWQKEISCSFPPCPDSKRVLVGYEINQTLEVKIRKLEKIGDIIQAATEAGANEVGDLRFAIEKEEEIKRQVRAEAIEEAKNKAKELSNQLGVRLVRIVSFAENASSPVLYPYYLKTETAASGAEKPDIQTGENKIEVTVNITYEIE